MKLLTIHKYIDFFISFSCALVIFIPGIKFFYFSSLVNFSVLVFLLCSILISHKLYGTTLDLKQKKIILYTSAIFWILLFSGIFSDASVSFFSIFRYVSVWIILSCVIILSTKVKRNYFYIIVVGWSVFLGFCYQYNIIEPSGDGELSYLILAMQLGIGFSICISKVAYLRKISFFYGLISLFILYCMLTLAGRAALIGIVFVLVFVFLALIFYYWRKRILLIGSILIVIAIGMLASVDYLLDNVLNEYLIYKVTESNASNNSRLAYYSHSLEIIFNNPFGIGLQKYNSVLGFYPHNIFLEMGLNAGIVPMLLLIYPFVSFNIKMLGVCTNIKKVDILPLGSLTLFLTFCWMFSNDLGSSYVLFTAMIIFFLSEETHDSAKN